MYNFPSLENLMERMKNGFNIGKYTLKVELYEIFPWTTYMLSRTSLFSGGIPYSNIQLLSNEILANIGSGIEKTGYLLIALAGINLIAPRVYGISKMRHGWKKLAGALVTSGVYDFVRHPMYLGGRLMSLGYFLQNPSVGSALGCLAVYVATEVAARGEERILEIEWGEEAKEYKERVPRWIPRINEISENIKKQLKKASNLHEV